MPGAFGCKHLGFEMNVDDECCDDCDYYKEEEDE